jgi:hypothetical protein
MAKMAFHAIDSISAATFPTKVPACIVASKRMAQASDRWCWIRLFHACFDWSWSEWHSQTGGNQLFLLYSADETNSNREHWLRRSCLAIIALIFEFFLHVESAFIIAVNG